MQKSNLVVYTPYSRHQIGFFRSWIVMIQNIYRSRELIIQLFKRDFFMSYKKSFLGMSWILISPIIGIVSWVFMNQTGILSPGEVDIPYPAYVLISSSIWGLFMGYYGASSQTLDAGGEFIAQVRYPHEALLFKQTGQHLANFFITFLLNIVVLLAFGVVPHWSIILFPVLSLPLFLLGAAMGLIISVVNIVASDITRIFNTLLGFVFYITPVIYSKDINNDTLKKVIELNPLTYLVGGIRDLIIYGQMDNPDRFIISTGLAVILFLISWRLFFISEDRVIERMI